MQLLAHSRERIQQKARGSRQRTESAHSPIIVMGKRQTKLGETKSIYLNDKTATKSPVEPEWDSEKKTARS